MVRKNWHGPFLNGSFDLLPQYMWMKMGSMGTHESPLYRHAHFMIITCNLGQVIVKSAHWHTDSCCCLLGLSLPCYDLRIFFMLNAVPVRVSGQYFSLFCVGNWFPIINIYIYLHKAAYLPSPMLIRVLNTWQISH